VVGVAEEGRVWGMVGEGEVGMLVMTMMTLGLSCLVTMIFWMHPVMVGVRVRVGIGGAATVAAEEVDDDRMPFFL